MVMKNLEMSDAKCLLGNHDSMLLGMLEVDERKEEIYRLQNARKKLNEQDFIELSKRLPFLNETIAGKRILFVHGSPWNPLMGYVFPDSDLKMFSVLPYDYIFMGHSHYPFSKKSGHVTIVNVGSCGLPRDHSSLLSCAVYNTVSMESEIIRLPFDIEELLDKYKNQIHSSVIDKFKQKSNKNIVGKIIKG
jgi:predicted phosphodiesterase